MAESLGSFLRNEREMQQMSVAELAQITRIPVRILNQIESDQFDELPAEVFVRGFLRAYARAIGIDDDEVLAWYQRGYGSDGEESTQLPNVAAPEGGHSFGIAIALVILLILFTLALSFVLRPRHRDVPVELSHINAEDARISLVHETIVV
jgi:cytoskeletal protein RodZ